MLQEFVPGYIHDACVLAKDGEVVQLLTQVRKLMYPISGGVGAVNFTTHNAPVAALARRLVESLGWSGAAQIEFKLDERDGVYKLIEMNPKFWGTLDLAIRAGVDFPVLLRDLLLGRPVRERSYRAGVRYRFWFDRALAAHWQLARELGPGAVRDPQPYAATFSDFDWRDPVPDLVRAANSLGRLAGGRAVPCDAGVPARCINPLRRRLPEVW
jgi:predicted ATP-grasp superfamily ATP-dependent carboligase